MGELLPAYCSHSSSARGSSLNDPLVSSTDCPSRNEARSLPWLSVLMVFLELMSMRHHSTSDVYSFHSRLYF